MNLKSAKIVFLFIITVLLTEGVAGAQGFGHSAVVGMTRRLWQVKNFERPLGGKMLYIKPSLVPTHNFHPASVSSASLSNQVTRAASSARNAAQSGRPIMAPAATASPFVPIVPAEQDPFLTATFQARPKPTRRLENFVSGTVFKTTYNGQEELYGVVPMHAFAQTSSDWMDMVGHHFTADVWNPVSRQFVSIPAEVVQISAPEFLDAALVKFNKQEEALLHPLSLNIQMPTWNMSLNSQGFTFRKPVYIAQRRVTKIEPFALQTTMPWPRDDRKGLCGGPVVDQDGRLVGIHNGSSYIGTNEAYDKGYITPAWILERLVQAYKNEGKAKIPLRINDVTLIELNVDEYISNVVLRGSDESVVESYTVDYKFSYQHLEQMLEEHYARYIDFTVQQVRWNDSRHFLEDSRFSTSAEETVYRYDTQTEQLERLPGVATSPAVAQKQSFFSRIFKRK